MFKYVTRIKFIYYKGMFKTNVVSYHKYCYAQNKTPITMYNIQN